MKTVKTIDKLDLDKIESMIKEMSKSLSDRAVVINVIIANNQTLTNSNHNIFNSTMDDSNIDNA